MNVIPEIDEAEPAALAAEQATHSAGGDWRRPGRIEDVPSVLIPLFRQPVGAIDRETSHDDLRVSKGIFIGFLLSIPLWGLIVGAILLLLR